MTAVRLQQTGEIRGTAEAAAAPLPHNEELRPSPAQVFLGQALGSNWGDMRLPALLLTAALLVSVIGAWWRRRRRAGHGEDAAESS